MSFLLEKWDSKDKFPHTPAAWDADKPILFLKKVHMVARFDFSVLSKDSSFAVWLKLLSFIRVRLKRSSPKSFVFINIIS